MPGTVHSRSLNSVNSASSGTGSLPPSPQAWRNLRESGSREAEHEAQKECRPAPAQAPPEPADSGKRRLRDRNKAVEGMGCAGRGGRQGSAVAWVGWVAGMGWQTKAPEPGDPMFMQQCHLPIGGNTFLYDRGCSEGCGQD